MHFRLLFSEKKREQKEKRKKKKTAKRGKGKKITIFFFTSFPSSPEKKNFFPFLLQTTLSSSRKHDLPRRAHPGACARADPHHDGRADS